MRDLTEWEQKKYHWMTEEQLECYEMLCDICLGHNHVFGIIRPAGDHGICINAQHVHWMSTFDYSHLTRAVVYAHDRMIRFEIAPSGANMLKLFFHKRTDRDGDISYSHPTMETAIAKVRSSN